MKYTGNLLKMKAQINEKVDYQLPLGENLIPMNELIGKEIKLTYLDRINCVHCGKKTNKSFFQGYCYPCFASLPETDECIMQPELCKAHIGISRDIEWSKNNCLQDHIVYLAVSSGLKVGVTRLSQVPTRWIDQGAWKTIKLAQTPNRYTAGVIEVALKKYMADKTNWRHMLTNKIAIEVDLLAEKEKACELLTEEMKEFISNDNRIYELTYPVNQYPLKIKSIGFDKTKLISEVLSGIKGQYLLFSDGSVLNIRKHNGYLVELEV